MKTLCGFQFVFLFCSPLLSLAWVSEKNRRLFSRIFTRAMCGIIESFDELEVDLIQRLEAPDIVHIKQEDNVPKESSLWAAYSLCPAFQSTFNKKRR